MRETLSAAAERLSALGCTVNTCEPMRLHTSFKIGGEADLFVTVSTKKQL